MLMYKIIRCPFAAQKIGLMFPCYDLSQSSEVNFCCIKRNTTITIFVVNLPETLRYTPFHVKVHEE